MKQPDSEEVPVIDIESLDCDYNTSRAAADVLIKACERFGFFYVRNPGLPSYVVDDVARLSYQIFALSDTAKRSISAVDTEAKLGYFGLYQELTNGDTGFDYKEMFDAMRDPPKNAIPGTPGSYKSLWPSEIFDARERVFAYIDAVEILARRIMRLCAIGLDLPSTWFDRAFDKPNSMLRFVRYPPIDARVSPGSLSCGAHRDYGCLTLILQHGSPGLKVETAGGHWIDIAPIAGTVVCNFGLMLRRWSNDRFAAALHQVENEGTTDRRSVVTFVDPHPQAEVACLKDCSGLDNPPKYPPILAGNCLKEALADAYIIQENRRTAVDP